MDSQSPNHRLAAAASRRHGVFRIDHVDEVGLSRGRLARMLAAGQAFRLYRGVFALGHVPRTFEANCRAAIDAVGPGAVLSGRAAVRLWGIERGAPSSSLEVTTPRRHRPVPGIRLRHTRSLVPDDITIRKGIPVLRVERLLVELADDYDEGRLCAWLDEARHRRLISERRLDRVMRRHRNRRGHARLVRALAMLADGGSGFRSAWEERVIGRLLVPPGVERRICTTTVLAGESCEPDAFYPTLALIVEADGPDHDRPNRRRADERRDRILAAADITTIRIHWSAEDAGVSRANAEIRRRTSAMLPK